MAFHTYFIP